MSSLLYFLLFQSCLLSRVRREAAGLPEQEEVLTPPATQVKIHMDWSRHFSSFSSLLLSSPILSSFCFSILSILSLLSSLFLPSLSYLSLLTSLSSLITISPISILFFSSHFSLFSHHYFYHHYPIPLFSLLSPELSLSFSIIDSPNFLSSIPLFSLHRIFISSVTSHHITSYHITPPLLSFIASPLLSFFYPIT